MWNARLDELQAGITMARRNINNLRYENDTPLMAESEEELKSFLIKIKEEREKIGLKQHSKNDHGIWSYHFTSSRKGKSRAMTDFILLGPWITVDDDWSHENRRHLLLGKKAMTNLDSILKSKDITLLTKVCLVKAMVFPVVTYGCESWTTKKAKDQIMDALKWWCCCLS